MPDGASVRSLIGWNYTSCLDVRVGTW